MKIRLGIWSEEPDYVQRAAAYIRSTPYRDRFRAALFTDGASCTAYLEGAEGLDVLLVDEPLANDFLSALAERKGCLLLRLTESPPSASQDGDRTLPRYSPLNALLERVSEELDRSLGYEAFRQTRGSSSPIWTVYSAVGGAGKSIFVHTAAALLAKLGLRPVVVSLEGVPSPWWSVSGRETDSFERALYQVIKEGEGASLDGLLAEEREGRFLVLPPASDPAEAEDMGEEQTERLLRALAASARGNVVLVDAESGKDPRTKAALTASHRTFFLVPDHSSGAVKSRSVLANWERWPGPPAGSGRKEPSIVYTMCGRTPGCLLEGVEAEEALPLVPDWLNLREPDQLTAFGQEYRERLLKWLNRLVAHDRAKGVFP